jgi:hypothetical protein
MFPWVLLNGVPPATLPSAPFSSSSSYYYYYYSFLNLIGVWW